MSSQKTSLGKERAKLHTGSHASARVMKEVQSIGRMAERAVPDRATLPLTPQQETVLAALTPEPASCGEIALRAGTTAKSLRSILLSLQAKGRAVRRNSDSKWSLP